MKSKKLAFAIVGWNQVEYVRNAIDSVLLNGGEGSTIYVSLTGGDPADHKIIQNEYGAIDKVYIDIIEHNGTNPKVGSLYRAYNNLMEKCKTAGNEYLNLIQSDFQLLWWNEKVFEHYMEIFEAFPNSIQINTGFFRSGSHPDMYTGERLKYKVLSNLKTIPFQHGSGISDWGLVNINRFFASEISWCATETFMSRDLSMRGYVLPFSRIPCVAAIPWPIVVRNGRELGSPFERPEKLYLRPIRDDALEVLNNQINSQLWQEDWVTSWGWWSLSPVWATELTEEFFFIAKKNTKIKKRYVWMRYGRKDSIIPPFIELHSPNKFSLLKYYIKFIIKNMQLKIQ